MVFKYINLGQNVYKNYVDFNIDKISNTRIYLFIYLSIYILFLFFIYISIYIYIYIYVLFIFIFVFTYFIYFKKNHNVKRGPLEGAFTRK